jgi:PAS domain S-box-containing protein
MNDRAEAKNRRVLVIDDNHAIHDDFRKILSPATATATALEAAEGAVFGATKEKVQESSFTVDSAYQGQEGVLLAQKALQDGLPYALAFVDVRMPPGWDGVETTQRIWAIDPELQIVLCTAYSDYSWGEMFEKLGRCGGLLILKKPFDAVEALQMAHALAEKWWLHQEYRRKMESLEDRVAESTRELQQGNLVLQAEVVKHQQAEERLQLKTAFLEAQVNSSIDGILVVDQDRKTALQNQRFVDLFKMPQHIAEEGFDENRLRWAKDMVKNSARFVKKIEDLYAHPNEISFDEVELKDGTILDRYSSPAVGKDGKYYGRIWTYRDVTARKQSEDALRESNEKFHQLADNITDAFWIRSPDMREVHYVSPAFEKIWGRSVESLYANPHQWADFILPEDRDRVLGAFAALTGETRSLDIEYRIVRPEGEIRWIRARGFQARDATNKMIRHIGIITDITERKKFDAHIFESQKLETIGKLAGGIAHEFNSILTAIIGHSDLLLQDLPKGSPFAKNAAEINQAAHRAAKLTLQLLAYGRKQMLQPVILDLNLIITGMEGMLRQILGDGVDLHVIPAPGLHAVKADAGQIEQAIMNLAVNGREAMPMGGKLTFETAEVHFDRDDLGRDPELKPGNYVMLAITDTGAGMSAEVKARLFEPFFTTKAVGQGTGLGLSTCHGIVKQSGGHISVDSEPGQGTTFKIYLPQVEQQASVSIPRPDSQDLPHGTETILLVEEDPALLKLAAILLRRLGYTILAAANGIEALSLRRQRNVGHIDLLFTDVILPHMGGMELADRVRASFPLVRILFTSSYTENAIVRQGVLEKGAALLQKPFTPSALARKVREVLDE